MKINTLSMLYGYFLSDIVEAKSSGPYIFAKINTMLATPSACMGSMQTHPIGYIKEINVIRTLSALVP